jgi:glucose/arabinose dehydrogenase
MKLKLIIITLLFLTTFPTHVLPQQQRNILTNLQVPWEIEKSGETFYITERTGFIVEYNENKANRFKVQFNKQLSQRGEGGLLGFQLAPSSTNKGFIYYTYIDGNSIFNAVAKVAKTENGWIETETLLDRIPGAVIHNGGRIKIGPDGMLYVTTGDAAQKMLAQDINSLAGKILRMDLNGQVPKDNPFQGSYVYSYGHRNPQGLAWSEFGTNFYASEHGPIGYDEVNEIVPGGNYGWPIIKGNEKRPNMITPLFHSGNSTWAPAGMDYKNGELYIATLRGSQILSFNVKDKTVESLFSGVGRIRDIYIENKKIYIVTSNKDGRGNPGLKDDRLILIEELF